MSKSKPTEPVRLRPRHERVACILAVVTMAGCMPQRGAKTAVAQALTTTAHPRAGALMHDNDQAARPVPPTTRTYYVAADVVEWDYAPSGMNQIAGRPFDEDEKKVTEPGATVIGRQVKKALYRAYTDDTFKTLKPVSREWEHLGMLGPVIHAQVGDTIRVVFRNNAPFPATVHPHNVLYDKTSEGAHYNDGSTGAARDDDGVPPGGTFVYTWQVPERAGPTEHEGSSTMAMYHSHHDEVRDIASGLMGAMVITRRGMARADGAPIDVDREIVAGFLEIDEAHSWFRDENIAAHATNPSQLNIRTGPFFNIVVLPNWDTYFRETINGYSFGHTPGMTVKVGERVRWYLMAGTDAEFHTPHWHGNVVTVSHMRTDVVSLMAMGMAVADMVPDNPGRWLFHCHVSIHQKAGMQAFYVVEPSARNSTRHE
jgi:hypothetical protein